MTRAELRDHLEHVHAPLCLSLPEIGGQFRQYAHHYTLDGVADPILNARPADLDALTIIQLNDEASFKATIASDAYQKFVLPDEDRFREREGSVGLPVRETVFHNGSSRSQRRVFHLRRVVTGLGSRLI
jgi:hypothetical protein